MENPSSNYPSKKGDGPHAGKKSGQQQTHKNAQRTGNRSNRSIIFVPSTSTSDSAFPIKYPPAFYHVLGQRRLYWGFNLLLSPLTNNNTDETEDPPPVIYLPPQSTPFPIHKSIWSSISHNLHDIQETFSLPNDTNKMSYYVHIPDDGKTKLPSLPQMLKDNKKHHLLGSVVIESRTETLFHQMWSLAYHMSRYWVSKAEICPIPVIALLLIAIPKAYYRNGLGKLLLYSIISYAKRCYDPYYIELHTQSSNTIAVSLYKSFGFELVQQIKGYYHHFSPPDDEAYLMRLDLAKWDEKATFIWEPSPKSLS